MVVTRRDGDDLWIEVRDNGIGLTPEARQGLFDETYVSRDSRNHHTPRGLEFNVAGIGFGLTLVRRIVEAHRGRLLVESEEGRGSTFTMIFPAALVAPEHERRAA
jgi:signal transduction histidine kinase